MSPQDRLTRADLELFHQGSHERLWQVLGAHHRDGGTWFAVWAPNAQRVCVVGDFNEWNGRNHAMTRFDEPAALSGVWALFIAGVGPGDLYKFEVVGADEQVTQRADPFAFATEKMPGTASVISRSNHAWSDDAWMQQRRSTNLAHAPFSVYEVHIGSWGNDDSYRKLAEKLPDYIADLGFTHVEFLPITEHPYAGSWGYQATGYFAPTSRYGTADDFKFLINALHVKGIGVIVDWVPAHFAGDEWALARFDGSALYEHKDPRRSLHPDWGTIIFDYGKPEVRNFLIASALFWLEEFHIDGLRVDAVASMLYLDYSRAAGQWEPNQYGGRENLEAISFLRELNATVHRLHPDVVTIAEESTAWEGVSRPVEHGGLGFDFKWNMGWTHDTLRYLSLEPARRPERHGDVIFGLVYAFDENFMLPLSHDEVVHGKGSLLAKMGGNDFANDLAGHVGEDDEKLLTFRALLGWMWAYPGKKLLFMGDELGAPGEWSHDRPLDWALLEQPQHAAVQALVAESSQQYKSLPALWEADGQRHGFQWIDTGDVGNSVFSFIRHAAEGSGKSAESSGKLVCVANFSAHSLHDYRIGLPHGGPWHQVLRTDGKAHEPLDIRDHEGCHGLPASVILALPPLTVLWLIPGALVVAKIGYQ